MAEGTSAQQMADARGADPGAAADTPLLVGPQRAPLRLLGLAGLGAAAGIALLLANGWLDRPPPSPAPATSSGQRTTVARLSAAEAPGFMQAVDPVLANQSPHVFALLVMPEEQKARLKRALAETPLRIGAITVWDNVDEDGDHIRIDAAGFAQELMIRHQPRTFFVPYLPGTSVRIEGTRDGRGGITLGVKTALGPLLLPPLAVGQVVEIALP
jgi:hypothetical protein